MGDSSGVGSYGDVSFEAPSARPGPGINPDASKWSTAEVGKWLESRGLREHVNTFKDNDVNGNLLLRLDKVDLAWLSCLFRRGSASCVGNHPRSDAACAPPAPRASRRTR
jgi:hypothetical protein